MATTENNIFLNPAELATEIHAVMEADTALHREQLAQRIARKMIEAARQPAPKAEVITRFAGLDFERFYLQPMDGPDRERNTQLAVAYCLSHPQWRLSVQTHKYLGLP